MSRNNQQGSDVVDGYDEDGIDEMMYSDQRGDHRMMHDGAGDQVDSNNSWPNSHAVRPLFSTGSPSCRRRVTTAAARMPSQRGFSGPTEPPAVMETTSGSSGMPSVAVGMIEHSGDSQSGSARKIPAAFYAPPLDPQNNGQPDTTNPDNMDDESFLPEAPYGNMMRNFGREDPDVERVRTQVAAGREREASLPMALPGAPRPPNLRAVEPVMPSSRLSRRVLTMKPKRTPDFVKAKPSEQTTPWDADDVECPSCGSALQIPQTAVVVYCPACERVVPSATMRVLTVGGGHGR